jgi:hypothetical protein
MPFGILYLELLQNWKIMKFSKKNLEFFLKKGKKKSIWVEARELKLCMNMFWQLKHKTAY